ncbi:MAG: LysR family transcriptional regulator [Phycisphaerales bacterium]|nr:LysR family transcriptional regulator [Phycisphaerales bacterium]
MELTPLRYLIAIAEEGHMTRSAEKLGVTQPALSAMLRKLEDEVGADLFHRTARGMVPTDAGEVFLEHARAAVQRADAGVQAVRALTGLLEGSIRIGGGATAVGSLLPRAISRFRTEHPGLRFFIREAGSSVVAASVLSGELDLGIITEPLSLPPGIAGLSELMTIPLVTDELRLIVPRGHRLDGRRTFRWSDLDGEPVVCFEAGSAVRAVIDRASAGVRLDIVMELRSIESLKQMVKVGIGVGLVSRLALGTKEGLGCADGRVERRLAVVRRRDRIPSAAASRFESILTDVGNEFERP